MSDTDLDENSITFGKYKDLTLTHMLRDRNYCKWLLEQNWFKKQYPFLYNRVKEHKPKEKFFSKPHFHFTIDTSLENFLQHYDYFNLHKTKKVKNLSKKEKICYKYYRAIIKKLQKKIINNNNINPYDIKAPSGWLKKFEKITNLSRKTFKEFLNAHELPNIPYIVKDIKKMGGIDYKGADSYIIAKKRSIKQEKHWENILREIFNENISTQFKYKNCIFDLICISTNTLYECKLSLKDFNRDQYRKYKATLGKYNLVYLIDYDCIIDIPSQTIFTTNKNKYIDYIVKLHSKQKINKLEETIKNYTIQETDNLQKILN